MKTTGYANAESPPKFFECPDAGAGYRKSKDGSLVSPLFPFPHPMIFSLSYSDIDV